MKVPRSFGLSWRMVMRGLSSQPVRGGRAMLAVGAFAGLLLTGGVQALSRSASAVEVQAKSANMFQQRADQLGARKCVDLFAELGNRVTQGSTYAVQVEVHKAAPDAHVLQGVAGMAYNLPDVKGSAAAVVLAAPTAHGCEGNMVRVMPFARACQKVAALLPSASVAAGDLAGIPLYNVPSSQDRVLLIATGPESCVAVSVNQGTSG